VFHDMASMNGGYKSLNKILLQERKIHVTLIIVPKSTGTRLVSDPAIRTR
jgi:hypothetical protein